MRKGLSLRCFIGRLAVAVLFIIVALPSTAFAAVGNNSVSLNARMGEGVSAGVSSLEASAMNADAVSSLAIGHDSWTRGSGTAEDPYLIESAENLAYLRDQVNAGPTANSTNLGMYSGVYFKQVVDIDLGNA